MDLKFSLREKELHFLLEKQLTHRLMLFGLKHGFFSTDLREKAFTLLFNVSIQAEIQEARSFIQASEGAKLNEIQEGVVIKNDVERSFNTSLTVSGIEAREKEELRGKLLVLLKGFFLAHPEFSYYQGFNAIAETFLMSFGVDLGFVFLKHFSILFLKPFLQAKQLVTVLDKINEKIVRIIKSETAIEFGKDQLFLVIGWVISYFSHNLPSTDLVWRLWDFLICLKLGLKDPKQLSKDLPPELSKLRLLTTSEQKKVEDNLNRVSPVDDDETLIEYVVSKVLIYYIGKTNGKTQDPDHRFRFIKKIPAEMLDETNFEIILLRSIALIQTFD